MKNKTFETDDPQSNLEMLRVLAEGARPFSVRRVQYQTSNVGREYHLPIDVEWIEYTGKKSGGISWCCMSPYFYCCYTIERLCLCEYAYVSACLRDSALERNLSPCRIAAFVGTDVSRPAAAPRRRLSGPGCRGAGATPLTRPSGGTPPRPAATPHLARRRCLALARPGLAG